MPQTNVDLFTVVMMFKSGHQRVMGWHRFLDAQQAFERIEAARNLQFGDQATIAEAINLLQVDKNSDAFQHGPFVRLTDNYRQTFSVDVRELVSVGLSDNEEANKLSATVQYQQLRGQLFGSELIEKDAPLKIAMGGGAIKRGALSS